MTADAGPVGQWPAGQRSRSWARSAVHAGRGCVSRRGQDSGRPVIRDSWRRSALYGVDPDRADLPFMPDFDSDSPLLRAAVPVMDRLADRLGRSGCAVILADRTARIVTRRVPENDLRRQLDAVQAAEGFGYGEDVIGTNGLGTVMELRQPLEVVGAEHYADWLSELTCVGVPVVNRMTGQVEGVLDVTCHVSKTSSLMLPLVEEAALEIEERLYLQREVAERALLQHFLRAARCAGHGVVAINERTVISNSGAGRLLAGVEHGLLWEAVGRVVSTGRAAEQDLVLPDDRKIALRILPLSDGCAPIGALVELQPRPGTEQAGAARGAAPRAHDGGLAGLAGRNPRWLQCCREARETAAQGVALLLAGEPGAGKTAIAAATHRQLRGARPLIGAEAATASIDGAAAWLAGIRSQIRGTRPGTLLVRDLQCLSPAVLRGLRAVLADAERAGWLLIGTVTHIAPGGEDIGTFDATRIEVPPLRDRLEDVAALAAALLERRGRVTGGARAVIAPEVVQILQRLSWPGNVSQLAGVLDSLVARNRTGIIRAVDVPPEILLAAARRPLSRFEVAETHAVLAALDETGGNKKAAAALLGISRSTLYRKLRCYGLDLKNSTY